MARISTPSEKKENHIYQFHENNNNMIFFKSVFFREIDKIYKNGVIFSQWSRQKVLVFLTVATYYSGFPIVPNFRSIINDIWLKI